MIFPQGIVTRYLGATDHNGSRILAKSQFHRCTVPYDHGLDERANHEAAAVALTYRMCIDRGSQVNPVEWALLGARSESGDGYFFVLSST